MIKCYHCNKPASWLVPGKAGEIPYCLDCHDKLQRSLERRNAQLAQEMNFLLGMAEARVGLPGIFPRYEIPQPTIHQGPTTLNNIKVDRSVVGAINTGEIEKLDVALSHIKISGEGSLAKALQDFTQAVLTERGLNPEERQKLIEHVSFLADQGTLPKEQRKKEVMRLVLSDIANTVTTISGLASLWQQIHPLIRAFF